MIRKIKFGKIAIVIFLTVLIWVWTDLDLDEELTVPRITISVAHSPELLVSFNGQPEALINNIKLKGPAKKIGEVRRSYRLAYSKSSGFSQKERQDKRKRTPWPYG
jgi:hypothetical protein